MARGKAKGTGSKTHAIAEGEATSEFMTHDELRIANKDPKSDYSFRLRSKMDSSGGRDSYGFEPVTALNSCGEVLAGPLSFMNTKGKGQVVVDDVILCKRPIEAKLYFDKIDAEKYNRFQKFVRSAAPSARAQLRKIEEANGLAPTAEVNDNSRGFEFSQRTGPTEQ